MNEAQPQLSRGIPDIGTKTTMANLAAAFVSLPFRRACELDLARIKRCPRDRARMLLTLYRARSSGG